ncbi:YciI family protein [Kingella negevensis]|uniref:YciI family protein n=1 Tax=Kingella negevensis TaxID=1522312 RepID=UPI000AA2FDE4|nr:YciI family protein [Kingella negevensis]MDK4688552.1 YciI family protein [Kingella negevensis]WII91705.1 YciI family protein [Kingella negevensis]
MLYMILATDEDNTSEQRAQARPAHLERLKALDEQGRLLTAGPNPMPEDPNTMSGSLIIADFDSLDAAEEWAGQDPYVQAGVYAEVLIKPYKKVFPQ